MSVCQLPEGFLFLIIITIKFEGDLSLMPGRQK